jgi:TonB family protein
VYNCRLGSVNPTCRSAVAARLIRRAFAVAAAALIAATPVAPRAQNAAPPAQAPPTQQPQAQTPAPAPGSGAPQDVYTIGREVAAPRLVSEVKPAYTAEAVRARIQGRVRLRGIVERDGTVSSIEVLNSLDTTYGLDQAAIDAFKQWRFMPATLAGNPVRVLVTVELTFALRDTPIKQTWPEGFTNAPAAQQTVDESAEARGMRLKITRPASWSRRASQPTEWISLSGSDGSAWLSVFRPEPATLELRWPAPDALVARVADTARRAQSVADAETLATGQIQGPGPFWVWSMMRLPQVPTPPGALTQSGPNVEARSWMFTGTVNGHTVGVLCTVLIPRGLEAPAVAARVQKAAADFSPIVNSIRIELVP